MAIVDPKLNEIAETIVSATGLDHIDLSELNDNSKLGEPPLEMDSIDVLEAVAAIEDKYGVQVADAKEGAAHFQTLKTIADFINNKNS